MDVLCEGVSVCHPSQAPSVLQTPDPAVGLRGPHSVTPMTSHESLVA